MKKITFLSVLFLSLLFFETRAQEVTTLAGSSQGYVDGTGTAAKFYKPAAIAVDANGNLYVA
ncbi:MAG: hypothetical protein COA58_16080, partial [Bacteroidetes bacterium]